MIKLASHVPFLNIPRTLKIFRKSRNFSVARLYNSFSFYYDRQPF